MGIDYNDSLGQEKKEEEGKTEEKEEGDNKEDEDASSSSSDEETTSSDYNTSSGYTSSEYLGKGYVVYNRYAQHRVVNCATVLIINFAYIDSERQEKRESTFNVTEVEISEDKPEEPNAESPSVKEEEPKEEPTQEIEESPKEEVNFYFMSCGFIKQGQQIKEEVQPPEVQARSKKCLWLKEKQEDDNEAKQLQEAERLRVEQEKAEAAKKQVGVASDLTTQARGRNSVGQRERST